MIIDKLYKAVKEKSCICVGLDSHIDYVPKYILDKNDKLEDKIFEYNKAIIDSTYDLVAVYKLQIAYYEAMGISGMLAYKKTLEYLRSKDLLTIGDVKRGDIAATAKEYAKAHFSGDFEVDFITLNPYMGLDSITPYLNYLKEGNRGVFVLLRTSNSGAKDIQYLHVNGEPLYNNLGDRLVKLGNEFIGESGFSSLGMVVGGTHKEEAKDIRERYKGSFFLIPGYGAQGASAEDIRTYLGNFDGGVVNSSRGIITAYKKFEDGEENFEYYTRQAVINMRNDIYGK